MKAGGYRGVVNIEDMRHFRKTAAFWSSFGGAAVIRCWSNADEEPGRFWQEKSLNTPQKRRKMSVFVITADLGWGIHDIRHSQAN